MRGSLVRSFRERASGALGRMAVSAVAAALAIAISLMIIGITGTSPSAALRALVRGALGSERRIAGTLTNMIPLVLVALGWVIAFTGRRINVGLEGQVLVGGIAATSVGVWISLPLWLHLPVAVLAGAAGGAFYAGIAAWLWAKRQVNEIISTLLLNFVAINLVSWLIRGPLGEPTGTLAASAPVRSTARWPALLAGTALRWDLILIAIMVPAVSLLLRGTAFGLRLRLSGKNEHAARLAGIPTVRVGAAALVLSGAFAGLAGSSLILAGHTGAMADNFSAGFGFQGIVVGLVAHNSAGGVIPAAALFAGLSQGGGFMEASVGVSSAMVLVTQGIVVLLVAAGQVALRRKSAGVQAAAPRQPIKSNEEEQTAPVGTATGDLDGAV